MRIIREITGCNQQKSNKLVVFYQLLSVDKVLPIYSPSDVNPKLVDPSMKHIQKNHEIQKVSSPTPRQVTVTKYFFCMRADFFCWQRVFFSFATL